MTNVRRLFEDDAMAEARRTNSLAALAVTVFLVVAGLYIIRTLHTERAYQNCVLSGQLYCDQTR
jgi:hypothetical protein